MPNWDDDDDQNTNDSDLVKDLRRQLRELAKARKELDTELSTLRPQVRRQSVSSVLSELGVNTKIAGILPESVDPTKEAVQKWLEDYGDLFNISQAKPEDKTQDNKPEVPAAPALPPDVQAQWARIQGGDTTVGAAMPDQQNEQLAFLGKAVAESGGSFDNYIALLRNQGVTPM